MTDRGVTRRGLLQSAGIAGVGIGLGAGAGYAIGSDGGGDGTGTVPFHGDRQAGIVTAAQDRLHFAAFDVTAEGRDELSAVRFAQAAAALRVQRRGGRAGAPTRADLEEFLGHPRDA